MRVSEMEVYRLVADGHSTPKAVGRVLGIKRTEAFAILARLERRGWLIRVGNAFFAHDSRVARAIEEMRRGA